MSDDRQTQAAAEAERRWPRKQSPGDPYPASRYRRMSMDRRIGFMQGVEWADANPQPRTITLAQSEAILEAGRSGRYEDHEAALRAAGIEVDDE